MQDASLPGPTDMEVVRQVKCVWSVASGLVCKRRERRFRLGRDCLLVPCVCSGAGAVWFLAMLTQCLVGASHVTLCYVMLPEGTKERRHMGDCLSQCLLHDCHHSCVFCQDRTSLLETSYKAEMPCRVHLSSLYPTVSTFFFFFFLHFAPGSPHNKSCNLRC